MGNRTYLTFDNYCEFDANNCLPVTWLALFTPQDFLTEEREEDDGKFIVILYRTTRELAIQRVEDAINKTKQNSAVWPYLRPLELLKNELELCPVKGKIELDATQLSQIDSTFEQKIIHAVSIFTSAINNFNGNEIFDTKALNQLIESFNPWGTSSISDLDPEEKINMLIGFYEGNPEHEKLYSFEYFNEDYWKA